MTDRALLRAAFRSMRAAMLADMPATVRAGLERQLRDRLLPALAAVPVVAHYAACRGEIDAGVFAGTAVRAVWPRVSPATGLLTFHLCKAADLRPGFGGILEPPPAAPSADPDLLLVPLVACDPYGTRLGHGGGHYDRALAALRARKAIRAVGLAWECQVADALPRASWDQPLDAIATPHRWIIPPG